MNPISTVRPRGPAGSHERRGTRVASGWLLLLSSLCIPASAMAAAPQSNLDPERAVRGRMAAEFRSSRFDQSSSKMVKVIIQYKQPVATSQEAPGERDLKNQGALLHTRFSSIRATVMSVPAWMIPQIAKNPNVAYVTPDRPVQMADSQDEDPITATSRDVAATQFSVDGTGVGVAVIDSGVSDHPDLHNASGASRVVYSESF